MKIPDIEKIKQIHPAKRKKFLTVLGLVILFNLFLVIGFIILTIALHQPLNTPACIFAFTLSSISLVGLISFWLIFRSAYKNTPCSENKFQ
jgi:hypothetical protein